jgi:Glycosyl hydrolase family 26
LLSRRIDVKSRVVLLAAILASSLLLSAIARPGPAAAFRVATGAYIPGADRNPHLIDDYANSVGRHPLIVSFYRVWGPPPFEPSQLDPVAQRGAVPMITWEPWDDDEVSVPLASIAAGGEDGYLREAAQAAAAWGQPIFLRFAHEMNGKWYPWGREITPAIFKAAWRHVVDVFRTNGANNVRWVWCPYVSTGHSRRFKRFYPGDAWVDWACLDGFNWGAYRTWQSFKRIFGASYQSLIRLTSRPVMIGETGVNQVGGDKSRWIATSFRHKLPRYTHVRALVIFDAADERADFRVDSSAGALAAIRRAFETRLFGSSREALLNMPPSLGAGHRSRRRSHHSINGSNLGRG